MKHQKTHVCVNFSGGLCAHYTNLKCCCGYQKQSICVYVRRNM